MLINSLLVVAALVVFVARRPAAFRIMRSATISAPPAIVFAQVNDLHRYQAWSPWAKQDPTAKEVFEGPPAGIGAALVWSGDKLGQGRLTITRSRPGELVRFRLDFRKPFAATNTAEFTFQPEGEEQTVVTWSMAGRRNFLCKAVGLFMNCDRMIGGTFEKGLADLKTVSEEAAAELSVAAGG